MEWRTLWTVKISCPNSVPHQHITEKTESAFAVYNTASQQQETSVCYQHFFSPKTKTASFQMPQRKKKQLSPWWNYIQTNLYLQPGLSVPNSRIQHLLLLSFVWLW